MRKSIFHGVSSVLALAAVMFAPAMGALAISVQPVVVELQPSGRGMNQVVIVENTAVSPLSVELSVKQLTFDSNGVVVTGADPGDLVVFPPQALIAPGQTQTFRVQYVGDPALAASKHYYVTVAQLPVEAPKAPSQIQVLFDFEVLVSVGPQGAKPNFHVVSAEIGRNEAGKPVPVVTLANDSPTYGYLSRGRLRIVEKDPAGREVFRQTVSGPEIQQILGMGLIASRQTRRFVVPVILPVVGGTVDVQFAPER